MSLHLELPPNSPARPTLSQRASVFLFILIPWLAMYFAIQGDRRPDQPHRPSRSPSKTKLKPVWQWTVIIYVSAYLQAPLAVAMAASQRGLRRFAYAGALSSIIIGFCWVVIPAVVVHRPDHPHGFLGEILTFERAMDDGTVSFPSMHVMWAFIAADVWTDRARITHRGYLRAIGWIWAVAIAITTITTGMHYLLDIFAAVLVYLMVRDPEELMRTIRRRTEVRRPKSETAR